MANIPIRVDDSFDVTGMEWVEKEHPKDIHIHLASLSRAGLQADLSYLNGPGMEFVEVRGKLVVLRDGKVAGWWLILSP